MKRSFSSYSEAFKSICIPGKPGACWEAPEYPGGAGYSRIRLTLNGKRQSHRTHRVAWEETVGPIPEGLDVLHKCDNRCCWNPDHLFLGNDQDNVDDKVRKGRQTRKYSNEVMLDIIDRINRGETRIAPRLGLPAQLVCDVRHGRRNQWLTTTPRQLTLQLTQELSQ